MNNTKVQPRPEFKVHSRVLWQALRRLQPVAKAAGNVLPVVNGHVHVGLNGNQATLTATDLETRVSVIITTQNTTALHPDDADDAAPQLTLPAATEEPADEDFDGAFYELPDEDAAEFVKEGRSPRYRKAAEKAEAPQPEPEEVAVYEFPEEESDEEEEVDGYEFPEEEYEDDEPGEDALPFDNNTKGAATAYTYESPVFDSEFLVPIEALPILESINGTVTVSYHDKDGIINIAGTGGCWSFLSPSAHDFPLRRRAFSATDTIVVNAEVLTKAIKQIGFACGTDTLRPAMTGIYVYVVNSVVTLVATNAHILLTKQLECPIVNATNSFILRKEIVRALANYEGEVELQYDHDTAQIKISGRGFELMSNVIGERYPDFSVVIPAKESPATLVSIGKGALLNSLKRAKLLTDAATHGVDMRIEAGKITLSADIVESGLLAMSETLPAMVERINEKEAEATGEPIEIRLNSHFFFDVVSNFGVSNDTTTFRIYAPNRPLIYELAGSDIALIMPLMKK